MEFIRDHFQSEDEALAEIASITYDATILESEASINDERRHDLHSMVYVLDGAVEIKVSETGAVHGFWAGNQDLWASRRKE